MQLYILRVYVLLDIRGHVVSLSRDSPTEQLLEELVSEANEDIAVLNGETMQMSFGLTSMHTC